jgi:hypothetical protein
LQRLRAPLVDASLFAKLEVQHMQLDTMAHHALPGLYEAAQYKAAASIELKLVEYHKKLRFEIPGKPAAHTFSFLFYFFIFFKCFFFER